MGGCNCGGKKPMPSARQQMKQLGVALVKMAQAIKKGEKIRTSKDEYIKRLKICFKCEHFDRPRCTQCGCFMRVKCAVSTESCPAEPPKWKRVDG